MDDRKNTLTGGEKFKLWQELVKAKGELESRRSSYDEAAADMGQRLGFKVTKSNITDAVRQGIVSWRGPTRGGRNAGVTTAALIKALTDRVAALEEVVLRLCEASGTGGRVEPMRAPEAWVNK